MSYLPALAQKQIITLPAKSIGLMETVLNYMGKYLALHFEATLNELNIYQRYK